MQRSVDIDLIGFDGSFAERGTEAVAARCKTPFALRITLRNSSRFATVALAEMIL